MFPIVASWNDVRRIALSLPETTEVVSWGNAHWRVKNKGFVWERPLGKSDLCFTIPHFDDFPAVLVRLERSGVAELQELIVEGWLDRAPARLAQQYLDSIS